MRNDQVATTEEQQTSSTPTHQQREPFMPVTVLTLAAPLLWVLHFAVLYLLEGFLCLPGRPALWIPMAILVATLLCGGVCLGLFMRGASWLEKGAAAELRSRDFLRAFQRMIAALSLVAILWSAAGALMIAPCSFAY